MGMYAVVERVPKGKEICKEALRLGFLAQPALGRLLVE